MFPLTLKRLNVGVQPFVREWARKIREWTGPIQKPVESESGIFYIGATYEDRAGSGLFNLRCRNMSFQLKWERRNDHPQDREAFGGEFVCR